MTIARTSGSRSHASTMSPSVVISSADSALRASGRFMRATPTCSCRSADDDVGLGGLHQSIAFTPVTDRPMISFWICEVPSYSVVTRASRR